MRSYSYSNCNSRLEILPNLSIVKYLITYHIFRIKQLTETSFLLSLRRSGHPWKKLTAVIFSAQNIKSDTEIKDDSYDVLTLSTVLLFYFLFSFYIKTIIFISRYIENFSRPHILTLWFYQGTLEHIKFQFKFINLSVHLKI